MIDVLFRRLLCALFRRPPRFPVFEGIESSGLPRIPWRIVETLPHDSSAFTQGLLYTDGRLFESTGLWGRSTLREIDLRDGRIVNTRSLGRQFFGEGLAAIGDRLIQLTWREKTALIYDLHSLDPIGRFRYRMEGWGLTFDGEQLVMSDGGPDLFLREPESFVRTARIEVRADGKPLAGMNDLQFVEGSIYANIWKSDVVACIDRDSGEVTSWLDLGKLATLAENSSPQQFTNGVTWDADRGLLLVTGKRWPRLFALEFG